MSKIPEKDIDRIFRDGSDRYDFPFNQEAWKGMEGLLDREKRRRALIWWTIGTLGILLLMLLLFWLKPTQPSSPSSPAEVSRQAIADLDHESHTPNRKTAIPPGATPQDQSKEALTNSDVINQTDNRSVDPLSEPTENQEKTPGKATATPSPWDLSVTAPPLASPRAQEQINPVLAEIDRQVTPGKQEPLSAMEQTNGEETKLPYPARQWNTFPMVASLEINPLFSSGSRILPNFPESQVAVEVPPNTPRNQFLMGASFAPEFNSVGYQDLSTVSWKWGLRLEYQYAGRFGITSGVHWVNKKYRAGAGSYTPPKGFWTRKIAPVETDGECTVLEIPIGLTFYPKGYDQSGFFSEVGMSSFLMLEEHYYYHYDVPDNDLVRYWGGENENQHWLGILNLSIGYNVILSDHLSARIAPYTQIPLNGVGHGQVKLTDLGAQFSFHYGLPGR